MAEGIAPPQRLRLELPGLPDRDWPLHGNRYRIGRASDGDITIDHPAVSRRHALLERHGSHWLLSDLGSTNGLWWQGRR
ncbi:MAG: FHA domain-containing protein, partial [Cyanobium sp.]